MSGRPLARRSEGYNTPAQRSACGSLRLADLSLPLTYAATTGQPVWLVPQADICAVFLPQWSKLSAAAGPRATTAQLGHLVQALSGRKPRMR